MARRGETPLRRGYDDTKRESDAGLHDVGQVGGHFTL